tara:strand:- start:358 stop:2070 length:1713 start_codon:yes stop_codon:yes gene_type:complete
LALIGWWRLSGKKLRAHHRLQSAIAALPFANERWMSDAGSEDMSAIAAARISKGLHSFSVHIHIANDDDCRVARRAIESALGQSEKPVRIFVTAPRAMIGLPAACDLICILQEPCQSRIAGLELSLAAAEELGIDYVVPLAVGAMLPRHSLAGYAAFNREQRHERLPILFGDQLEDLTHSNAAIGWFKPLWDQRMMLSQDYISSACALPVSPARRFFIKKDVQAPTCIYELILLMSLPPDTGVSVEKVQRITMRTVTGDWCTDGDAESQAVQNAGPENALVSAGPFGTVQLRWPLPQPIPKVSIIVATRDKLELLQTCVEGVLFQTTYPDIELIIADNDSRETATLEYLDEILKDPRVRVVRWPYPFNYSAINNFAAGHASGEYLCLLNNDIEVLEPQWLEEMVREAVQPGVGAVGARLLYPDRTIQHAGVALGIGNAAGHAHRGLQEDEAGYFAQTHIVRGASAVTAACMLVAKRHFDAVGGLDEDALAVAYNDVDLCLKLRMCGLVNIYTPLATLIHHESKSRGLDFAPEHLERYMRELAVFQQRWGAAEVVDPWHHPRLNRQSEVFS